VTTLTSATLALALAMGPGRNAPPPATPEAAPSAAGTATDAEIQQRIDAYLGSFDTPISAERWKALGPRAIPLLAAAARDPERFPSRRAKAIAALGAVGGPEARDAVLAAARAPDEPFAVRATALHAAGSLLSSKALVRELKPVMEREREPALRGVAADVLARHAGATGCTAVRVQATKEAPEVRGHFMQALQRCGQEP
jgi:HEAT repeat protein